MADEFVIDDDPTQTDDQARTDVSSQDNPPEEPVARAAYYENLFKEAKLETRGLTADKKRLEGIVEDERTSKKYWESEAKSKTAPPANNAEDTAATKAAARAVKKFDLAELTVSDDGGEQLVNIILDAVEERFKGLVTKEDVQGAIDGTLNRIVANGQLGEKYPDLLDAESAFTKEVNARVAELQKDPECEGMSQIALRRLAAAEVESESGGRKQQEDDRPNRVGRQSVQGGKGRRPAAKQTTELTDQQKKFARIAGISDEEYAKNATITTYPTLGPQ